MIPMINMYLFILAPIFTPCIIPIAFTINLIQVLFLLYSQTGLAFSNVNWIIHSHHLHPCTYVVSPVFTKLHNFKRIGSGQKNSEDPQSIISYLSYCNLPKFNLIEKKCYVYKGGKKWNVLGPSTTKNDPLIPCNAGNLYIHVTHSIKCTTDERHHHTVVISPPLHSPLPSQKSQRKENPKRRLATQSPSPPHPSPLSHH